MSRFYSILQSVFTDQRILVALAGVAALVGLGQLLSPAGDRVLNFPPYFCSSAVTVACGRGFTIPEPGSIPALTDFLDKRTQEFRPEDLPDTFPTWDHEAFRETHRYLLYALGFTWWLFGISWPASKILLLAIFCVTIALVYGLFRLGMNRFFSALGTVLFMLSPAVVSAAPMLRDFSKAPWMLGGMLILGHLAKRRVTGRAYLGLAALYGLVLGFGLGFRQDLLVGIPAGLVVFLLFARGKQPLKRRRRLAAVALLLACFYVPARPIMNATRHNGSLMYHNIINGFATESDDLMQVGRASYERAYCVNDNYAHSLRTSYVRRVKDSPKLIYNEGQDAADAGRQFVLENFLDFPADMLTRGFASVKFLLGDASLHLQLIALPTDPIPAKGTALLSPLAAHLRRYGALYAALSLLMMAARDLRAAWGALFLLLYFCAYPCLQFQLRHAFQFCFVSFWVLGFVVQRVCGSMASLRHAETWNRIRSTLRSPKRVWRGGLKHAVLSGLLATALLAAPLYAARAYQDWKISKVLANHEQAALASLDTTPEVIEDPAGNWLNLRPVDYPKPFIDNEDMWEWRVFEQYLVLELEGDLDGLPIWIRYDSETPSTDFSKVVYPMPCGTGTGNVTRYFFPVYEFPVCKTLGKSRFDGVAIPQSREASFRGLYRVLDLQDFPLFLNLTLPSDTACFRRHQT